MNSSDGFNKGLSLNFSGIYFKAPTLGEEYPNDSEIFAATLGRQIKSIN